MVTQESTAPGHYRWYVAALLMGIYVCQALDRTVLNTLLEPIKHEFGLSDSQLGMLGGIAYAIPNAITAIPFGMLADRVNRKRLLVLVVSVWSTLTAFSGLSTSYWMLLAARGGLGAMEAGCTPNATSLLVDYFPPRQRSVATAMTIGSTALGMLSGFILGGVIATSYGWRTAFFVAGIPGIVLSLLVLLTVREPQRGSAAQMQIKVPSLRETLAFIKSQKSLVHLICALTLLVACTLATTLWAASYLVRFHGMTTRDAGFILAIGLGVFSFLGTTAGGLIADRMGKINPRWKIKVPIIALLIFTALWSTMLLADSKSAAIIFLCASSIFSFVWVGPVYGLIVSLVEPRMRGTTMSLALLVSNGVGASIGPQLVGYISDQLTLFAGNESLRYALFAPVIMGLWAIGHCRAANRTIETDLQRIAQSAS